MNTQSILKKSTPTPSSIFQKIAFGDPREPVGKGLSRLQHKEPIEANTHSEQYVLELLKRWVMSSTDDIAQRLFLNYRLFKRASRIYPKIFAPKTEVGTILYRGLNYLTPKLLQKVQETKSYDWRQVQYNQRDYWIYSKPVEYTPERLVQSWTDSIEISGLFSREAVLITKQDNHFIFNKEAIAVIFGSDESEILHFGKTFRNPVYLAVNDQTYRKYVSPSETLNLKSIVSGLFEITSPDLTKLVKYAENKFGVEFDAYEFNDYIELHKIVVPPEERNKGIGSELLEKLLVFADKAKKDVFLTPSSDFGGNKARLIDFYKRFGFELNRGRNRDFRSKESMIRRHR